MGYIVVSAVCGRQVVRDCVPLWLILQYTGVWWTAGSWMTACVISLLCVPVNAAKVTIVSLSINGF